MTELLIINTRRHPSEAGIVDDRRGLVIDQHNEFLEEIKTRNPSFGFPYIALFENGTLFLPREWTPKYQDYESAKIVNGIIKKGRWPKDCTLTEFIEDNIQGYELANGGRAKGITGIIEFSPTELYPAAMENLTGRYNLTRIAL